MEELQLNNTELKLVQFLFDHQAEYIASKEIAASLGVSDKTIRKYLRSLSSVFEDYGSHVVMKKGSGYQLIIHESHDFYRLMDYVREQKVNTDNSILLTDNSDRERYILNAILLENQLLTIDDLVDLMYLSRSTISTVIQLIKSRIKKFRLSVSYDLDGHIVIEGDEVEKRRFILNYFYTMKSVDYVNSELFDYEFEGFSMETIFIIVLETCREFKLILSDYVLQNLVMHIVLAIMRNEKGFIIEPIPTNEEIEYSKELFVAEKIVSSIEKLLNIKFPAEESKYIALHLKSKSNQPIVYNVQEDDSLHHQLMRALTKLNESQPILFSIDQQLLMGLKVHFEPLLTRLQSGLNLDNPLYEEIVEKYPDLFQSTKEVFSKMPLLSAYQVSNHEWAYILLHILAAVERYKHDTKVNAIVICATGLGSAQMLKNRLENEFSVNLNIVDVISYYQLSDDMLKNVDLIISTIDISTSFYNVPVVKVSIFLNKQDIEALNKYIQGSSQAIELSKEKQDIKNEIEKVLNRYFNEDHFLVFNEKLSRENILDIMIQRLTDSHQENFAQDLKNQIQLREQFGTLAFSDLVAFPHPAQPVGITSEIVIGICQEGIKWDEDHH